MIREGPWVARDEALRQGCRLMVPLQARWPTGLEQQRYDPCRCRKVLTRPAVDAVMVGRGRRRWEEVLFTFMGPPQLGDLDAPDTSTPDPEAARCPSCAQPWEGHGRVRSSRGTRLTCPVDPRSP